MVVTMKVSRFARARCSLYKTLTRRRALLCPNQLLYIKNSDSQTVRARAESCVRRGSSLTRLRGGRRRLRRRPRRWPSVAPLRRPRAPLQVPLLSRLAPLLSLAPPHRLAWVELRSLAEALAAPTLRPVAEALAAPTLRPVTATPAIPGLLPSCQALPPFARRRL